MKKISLPVFLILIRLCTLNWFTLYNKIRAVLCSQLEFEEIKMDEELSKSDFLADFFCSELAVEVYKNSVREVTGPDRVKYLVSFAESLWRELCLAREDGDSNSEWS